MDLSNFTFTTSGTVVETPLGDMPVGYFLQLTTVAIIFIMSVVFGPDVWMKMDLCSMFVFGLLHLLFPFIFNSQVSDTAN